MATTRRRPRNKILIAATAVVLFFPIAAIVSIAMDNRPPETAYTQSEAYAPMEKAVAELVRALPDFPGFERRSWATLGCSHNGIGNHDFINVEIRYSFSDEVSSGELVRETYPEVLRDYWADLGYDIRRDEPADADRASDFRSLEATRSDGINFWYRVWDGVSLLVQSGCVPVSDSSEIEYFPPAGGIAPGSEADTVAHDRRYFPDGVPAGG